MLKALDGAYTLTGTNQDVDLTHIGYAMGEPESHTFPPESGHTCDE